MVRLVNVFLFTLVLFNFRCSSQQELRVIDADGYIESLLDKKADIRDINFDGSHFLYLDTTYIDRIGVILEKPLDEKLGNYYVDDYTNVSLNSSYKSIESLLSSGDIFFTNYLKEAFGFKYHKELILKNQILKSKNKALVIFVASQGEFCLILNLVKQKTLKVGVAYIVVSQLKTY